MDELFYTSPEPVVKGLQDLKGYYAGRHTTQAYSIEVRDTNVALFVYDPAGGLLMESKVYTSSRSFGPLSAYGEKRQAKELLAQAQHHLALRCDVRAQPVFGPWRHIAESGTVGYYTRQSYDVDVPHVTVSATTSEFTRDIIDAGLRAKGYRLEDK